jgi:hypothetical protein
MLVIEHGPVAIDTPRDRNGSFEPQSQGCHPQLQRRRVRRAVSALSWRAAADVFAAKAPRDQADRAERPQDLDQPFATWSLSKLADYLVAEGVVTDISHEGLRQRLRDENVRFQAVRTWKRSTDPDFLAKRDRIIELYEMAEAGQA